MERNSTSTLTKERVQEQNFTLYESNTLNETSHIHQKE